MKRLRGALLNLLILGFVVLYLLLTLGYSYSARLLPLIVVIPILFLTLLQSIADLIPALSRRFTSLGTIDTETIAGGGKDKEAKEEKSDPEVGKRELLSFFWLGVALLLIMLLGLFYSTPLFLFLFLKLGYKRGWGLSLLFSLGVTLAVYLLFVMGLEVQFYKGLLGVG